MLTLKNPIAQVVHSLPDPKFTTSAPMAESTEPASAEASTTARPNSSGSAERSSSAAPASAVGRAKPAQFSSVASYWVF